MNDDHRQSIDTRCNKITHSNCLICAMFALVICTRIDEIERGSPGIRCILPNGFDWNVFHHPTSTTLDLTFLTSLQNCMLGLCWLLCACAYVCLCEIVPSMQYAIVSIHMFYRTMTACWYEICIVIIVILFGCCCWYLPWFHHLNWQRALVHIANCGRVILIHTQTLTHTIIM